MKRYRRAELMNLTKNKGKQSQIRERGCEIIEKPDYCSQMSKNGVAQRNGNFGTAYDLLEI